MEQESRRVGLATRRVVPWRLRVLREGRDKPVFLYHIRFSNKPYREMYSLLTVVTSQYFSYIRFSSKPYRDMYSLLTVVTRQFDSLSWVLSLK